MNRRTLLLTVLIATVGAGGWIIWYVMLRGGADGRNAVAGQDPARRATEPRVARLGDDDVTPARDAKARLRDENADAGKREARARRDELWKAIQEARDAQRSEGEEDRGDEDRWRARVAGDELDPAYVQERLEKDMIPEARHCFNRVLLDNPGYSGKVVMEFAIVADEELGGVVEEVKLGKSDEPINDVGMLECLEEAMYSLSFDAPEAGGRVNVTYPLEFEPDE